MSDGTEGWDASPAARWIAEAIATGNPLAPLPAELVPPTLEDAQAVAAAVLDELSLVASGVRLMLRPSAPSIAGPMIDGRLLPRGATVALDSLRHPVVTGAVIGVLAEALDPDEDTAPRFAALHPAIDVSATRFGEPAVDALQLVADLARLGLVVPGRAKTLEPGSVAIRLAAPGSRRPGDACDLAAALAAAADAARRFGGLPAGALLVVAGLTPPLAEAAMRGPITASLGALGRAEAVLA